MNKQQTCRGECAYYYPLVGVMKLSPLQALGWKILLIGHITIPPQVHY